MRLFSLLLLSLLLMPLSTAAESSSPVPANGCSVEPRAQAEIDALVANAATPVSAPVLVWSVDGTPVDAALRAELEATLQQFEACLRTGDLPRLFALLTDGYILRGWLTSDSPPIEAVPAGTPEALPAESERSIPLPAIQDAQIQSDGSILAIVVTPMATSTSSILMRFERVDDLWLIDATTERVTPPGSLVDLVLEDASVQTGVSPAKIVVLESVISEWPDSGLGCPVEGGVFMPVITPGYLILLQAGDEQLEYHTDLQGNFVLCADG